VAEIARWKEQLERGKESKRPKLGNQKFGLSGVEE